jgi:glycosyltransferase involved in cell wall biosynthesis
MIPEKAMQVLMLRNVSEERNLSMKLYADRLSRGLHNHCAVESVVPWRQASVAAASRHGVAAKALDYVARYGVYPPSLIGRRGDIFHVVDHAYAHLLCCLPPRRTVVTCHDLMLLRMARDGFDPSYVIPPVAARLLSFSLRFLKRAAMVIADSQATADDLVKYLKIPREQIRVVHLGIDPMFAPPSGPDGRQVARARWGFEGRRVLLHVGNNWFYKNLEGVIRALAVLKDESGEDCPTLVKAGKGLTTEQRKLASELEVEGHIRELGVLNNVDLQAVYHAADMLVFPSWWEGFGWPPLEAMASGTPVICSDRGSLGEVAGDAALIVNPEEPEEIADAIIRVLHDENLRQSLITKGLERAKQFTWERAAEQTFEVYREVAG